MKKKAVPERIQPSYSAFMREGDTFPNRDRRIGAGLDLQCMYYKM